MQAMNEEKETQGPIPRQQVEKAVSALLKINDETSDKNSILSVYPRVNLLISSHKIPSKKGKTVLIKLPHALYTPQSEICVFAKDVDKKDVETSEDYYREIFSKAVGFTPKVIPLLSLRKDYKSFEAKRMLCDAHDLFVADDRIKHFLPARLGKHFYAKKKQPLKINLNSAKWKNDFMTLLSSTRWIISGLGDCSMIHTAYTNFPEEHIVDNIMITLQSIVASMIRGWSNVRSIHLKMDSSVAIPIYLSPTPPDDVDVKDEEELQYIEVRKAHRNRKDFYAPKIMRKRKSVKKRSKRRTRAKTASEEVADS